MSFWDTPLYGNTPVRWLTAAGVLVGALVVFRVAAALLVKRLRALARRTRTGLDDLAALLLERTGALFLIVVALWVSTWILALPGRVDRAMRVAAILAVLAQVGVWGAVVISFAIGRYRDRQLATDADAVTTMSAFGFLGKLALWSLLVLVALDNLGFHVKTLLAGLGVGGIAVALALQNILGDLFASLSIVLDKPFVIGDFLVMGEHMGTVERVGIKTTRLRSLSGEQLVFSNTDLLKARIRNYGRMRERRAVFQFGITYDTPPDVAARVPEMVRDMLEKHEQVRVDRAHFKSFGDSALQYEAVYFVSDPDFNLYMDIQQDVNIEMMRRFADEGVEFAFPTRTVLLERSGEEVAGSSRESPDA